MGVFIDNTEVAVPPPAAEDPKLSGAALLLASRVTWGVRIVFLSVASVA